jgi:WhiB family redox-sensing transcriptional regulator
MNHQQAREMAAVVAFPDAVNSATTQWPDRPAQRAAGTDPDSYDRTGQLGRGRLERRQHWTVTDPDWRELAECAGLDTDLFFPERGESSYHAKQVCAGCPVKDDCLADAMIWGERWGIRGGLSERQRRNLRADIPKEPIVCGTIRGYMRHYRNQHQACEPCLEAWRSRPRTDIDRRGMGKGNWK